MSREMVSAKSLVREELRERGDSWSSISLRRLAESSSYFSMAFWSAIPLAWSR
jgi:hypothetical protein